jgi:hypothetical protein
MQKLVFFPVLLVAACVVAAAYGAVHNQISYTVSPDFFHFDLFRRCDIPDDLRDRAGASLVGVLTTWWMGLVIGIPVFLLALILPGWKAYVKHSLIAVLLVVTTALVIGLGALAVARFATSHDEWGQAGMMHDFGYIGGGVGLLVAIAYLIVVRVRIGRTGQSS